MRLLIPVAALFLVAGTAQADEGMWTFDNFPSATVKERYGFAPDKAWLDHVQKSAVRLAGGCSASFVSPDGLVMTNHHCAHRCIEELSTGKKNFIAEGFYARTPAEERKCPAMEVNQLLEITDVTQRIQSATAGKSGADFSKAERQAMSEVEKSCATSSKLRCDVVTLYAGGKYDLYRYRRFQDVRLVFAPEFEVAFFGGDPDNFEFPRYDLDVSFVRVYDDGKPVKLDEWLRWSAAGAKEGDLVFVAGNPGRTDRLFTVAQLEFIRDVSQPMAQIYFSEERGILEEFSTKGPEQKRVSQSDIFGVENSLKAWKGRQATLVDQGFMEGKRAAEAVFKAKLGADPKLRDTAGAFEAIAKAETAYRSFYVRAMLLEGAPALTRVVGTPLGFRGELFANARILVRLAAEAAKPNGERLREFTDARQPAVEARLASTAPIHTDLEIELLTFSLTKLREWLGPDDALVKKVFGLKSPRQLATEVIKGTKLGEAKVRLALKAGGAAALAASKDPMIELARLVDPDARAMRLRFEQDVDSVVTQESAKLARARFAFSGTSAYPDATFSPRLSFGTIKGWTETDSLGGKRAVPAFTHFSGAYQRATGAFPFELPKSWLTARPRLDLETPFDQVSDNDIIGGNSGSPIINQKAEVVGLIFDGNIPSLGGDYVFDDANNRAVSVHSSALLQALDRIYGAKRVLNEIAPSGAPAAPGAGTR
ncbi:MAG: S46 family peptidase [Myxococcaceae bacterium]